MALTLLRHTRPDVAPGTCYGVTDLGLAPSFDTEARAILNVLPNVDRIVTSPLTRCRRLAEHIAEAVSCPLSVDDRLREIDFGRWEGLAWHQVPRSELDIWAADFLHARPHGGESVAMLRTRAHAALGELRRLDGHSLIVTHAGVIKVALATGDSAASHAETIDFGCFVTLDE